MNKNFMKLAINEARKSSEKLKCGVVIVKDGKVLAQTHNTQSQDNNSSAHAEINALKVAGQKLGNKNLDNCEIYCTCEPCIMCLTALAFAKIAKIFYGVNLSDVSPKNKRVDIDIDTFLKNSPRKIDIVKNFMESECKLLN